MVGTSATIFGEALYLTTLNIDSLKIMNKIKNLNFTHNGVDESTMESSTNLNVIKDLQLFDLKKKINDSLQEFIQNSLKIKINFNITRSWCTRAKHLTHSQKHNHSNSWLSGVYYPEKSSASIRLYKTFFGNTWDLQTPSEYNVFNAGHYDVSIKENLLIIFPSYLKHAVLKNTDKKTRYSIAFNVVPKGIIGTGDNQIKINCS